MEVRCSTGGWRNPLLGGYCMKRTLSHITLGFVLGIVTYAWAAQRQDIDGPHHRMYRNGALA